MKKIILRAAHEISDEFAEQKVETHASKEEWKLCALTGDDYDHHDKLGLPLPQGDKLKAILFDIDGTIADSDPIHFLAFQEILAEVGGAVDQVQVFWHFIVLY